MDVLSLYRQNALPVLLTPVSNRHVTFLHWSALIWIAWALALAVLATKGWTKGRQVWKRRARAAAGAA